MAKQQTSPPLDTIPYFGPWIVWVKETFGVKVCLIVAASFVVGLVVGGYVGFDLAGKSRIQDANSIARTTPGSIQLDILNDRYAWSVMFEDFLVAEVERERKSLATINQSMTYASSRLVHRIKKPYTRFSWVLDGRGNYRIAALGFLIRSNGSVQLLNRTARTNETSVVFDVPEGEVGDRLVAVVVVKWQEKSSSILDVREAISSHAS